MYLIASARLQKAKLDLSETKPYFNALQAEIKRIFRTAPDVDSKYFYPPDGDGMKDAVCGILVITADKGLAGAYNQNVIKKTTQVLSEHENTKLFVVGESGRRYFTQHGIPIERSFLYTAQNPTMHRAREICTLLLNMYGRGELGKIFLIYTDWKNSMVENVIATRLLPFHRQQFLNESEKTVTTPFEFFPSIEEVLDAVMESYISGYIYSALVDSLCSEQNSRMTAMDSANRNADKILSSLSVSYNRLRQSAITQEITEISSGAKALGR